MGHNKKTRQAAKASGRFCRISARKARLVADLVRGKNCEDAVGILKFTNKKAAVILKKILESAIANASQNPDVQNIDNLFIQSIWVDEGPTMKRFMARAMGRASRIRKRTCHINMLLHETIDKTEDKVDSKSEAA